MRNTLWRWFFYLTGLALMVTGGVLSMRANLGMSPVSLPPYTIYWITGLDLGLSHFLFFLFLVLIQVALLKRKSTIRIFLQIPFGMLFSVMMSAAVQLISFETPQSYWARLAILLGSMAMATLGIFLYTETNIVLNAPEGFQKTLASYLNIPFPKIKRASDCVFVVVATLASLLFTHSLTGIREGTFIFAFSVGKLLALIPAPFKKMIHDLSYGKDSPTPVHGKTLPPSDRRTRSIQKK